MTRLRTAFLLLVLVLAPAVVARYVGPAATGTASGTVPFVVTSDTSFAGTIERLSERGGYFDSDNLISNEASYLHVLGELREAGVSGGAYIGVGPDQNFSYIAHVRPSVAYIIDIRRDNLLQHLLFKALFAESRSRLEYLALLTARPLPDEREASTFERRGIDEHVARIDGGAMSTDRFRDANDRVVRTARSFGVPLSDADITTITAIHRAFAEAGLDLRFRSHGRGPRPYYPTFRQLLLETDREGDQANFLADEESFRFVRELQAANRIIPVVGDLAGEHALRAIGRDIERHGERVSAFYTSNVEYYLMADRSFERFIENVRTLPHDRRSVIIRSYFSRGYPHPESLPGYYSTQLVQNIDGMLALVGAGGVRSYFDLVNRR